MKEDREHDPSKYSAVNLCKGGRVTQFLVHHLVALVFLGPRPEGYHVDHKDGNRRNNAVTNLRYLTPGDNNREAGKRNGYKGQIEGARKLTDHDVRQIRDLYQQGTRQYALASRFNIAQSSISKIVNGKQWTHIE